MWYHSSIFFGRPLLDLSQNHAAMWSGKHTVRGAQYAPRGSEAEIHAGGHGMVLNLRQHNACSAIRNDRSPNQGREVPEN